MEPSAHIHRLPDDLLIQILWHSANPGTRKVESDALWTSLLHKPRYLHPNRAPGFDPPIESHFAPTDQLSTNSAGYHLLIASVCRRWRRLAQLSVSTLSVRPNLDVPLQTVATALAFFPNLTRLHLCDGSVATINDDFLNRLASSRSKLTSLYVGRSITLKNFGIRKNFSHPVTESGLDRLFQHCTQLKRLSFFGLREDMDLPASFFQLAHLHSLTLTTPLALESPHLASLSSLTALRVASHRINARQLAGLLRLPSIASLSISDETLISPSDQPAAALILPQLPLLSLESTLTIPSEIEPYNRLERLLITDSNQLMQLPGNIADALPYLRELSIRSCRNFSNLPDEFVYLSALESLTISSCCSFSSLPEDFFQLTALKTLVLEMLPLEKLPDSFCHRTFLESSTSDPPEQLSLPSSFTGLTISTCRMLSNLPEDFGHLPALKTLVLDNLALKSLPDSFGLLTSLETLFILDCDGIWKLPAGFCSLTALTTLCLVRQRLILPEDIGSLSRLHTLLLDGNTQKQPLPPSFTQLRSLTRLALNQCKIEMLPEDMGNLSRLKQLHIASCDQLSHLPASLSALRCLQILTVHFCQQLSWPSMRLDRLTRLKHLEITDCQLLPESVQCLPPSLEKLSLASRRSSPAPLLTIPVLPNLRELKLSRVHVCHTMEFSESLSSLKHLELVLEDAATELPLPLASLSQLHTLAIYHAAKIPSLPESIGFKLHQLRELQIHGAEELSELPESITQLQQLTRLEVHACKVTHLPEGIGALTRLCKLNLASCKALERLPASLTSLACLTELDLASTLIDSLPPRFVRLAALRCLVLDGCWRLSALPSDMADLKMLQYLGVKGCRQLMDRDGYVEPHSIYNSVLRIGL